MKVALYSRVSTKDKGQDVENQQRQLRDFAKKQGWTIVHEFSDNISGKTSDREQFKKMFIAASKREFDLLLFWSLDRLSREGALETLQHLQRLTSYGVGYRSFTEPYLDSLGAFREGSSRSSLVWHDRNVSGSAKGRLPDLKEQEHRASWRASTCEM